jgi:predicted methyltransferase
VYYYQKNLNDPTLAYVLEKDGKVFLVAINKEGWIKTFHFREKGWPEIIEGYTFYRLFKVDPF